MDIQPIKLYRGDTHALNFTATLNNEPVNFKDNQLLMQVRSSENGGLLMELSSDKGDFEIDENGYSAILRILPEHTRGASWRTAVYDVQLSNADGTSITLTRGNITLIHDVTQ